MKYFFYSKNDKKKEPIKTFYNIGSRLEAAKYFAELKKLSLKDFLKVFSISKWVMGFNKRYIDFDRIKNHYKQEGIESLKILFSPKIDAFIFSDRISHEIYKMYENKEYRKISCLLRTD